MGKMISGEGEGKGDGKGKKEKGDDARQTVDCKD